ncbi:MAG: hypothetical protein HY696_11780 [Deltaproteobacteria bacterium]|nr:hypothetical protein [Deltaproteobacteria bacterium]
MMAQLAALVLLFTGAALTATAPTAEWRRRWSCGAVLLAALCGVIGVVPLLGTATVTTWTLAGEPLPGLHLALGLDPLSAFFLLMLWVLAALTAWFAFEYLRDDATLLATAAWFPLLIASMAVVVLARNGFLLLLAWELMSLASFFLVTTDHESAVARRAGWLYFGIAHLATALLLVLFVTIGSAVGSLDFDQFRGIGDWNAGLRGTLFLCALIGFGTKAGLFPLHVWLPHAHPAAPSHISALMSAVMITLGMYGLLRVLSWLGLPPLWWGGLVIGLGSVGAVFGALYATMQRDCKALLAYSTVEHSGIIFIGIGLALLGATLHQPWICWLGGAGALWHIWNHALFKSLLFFAYGHVTHASGTRLLDRLGGLLRQLPITGAAAAIGTVAGSGLPPLNGFVSEWVLYLGLLRACQELHHVPLFLACGGMLALTLAGGLALVAFTKTFGTVFLGAPRTPLPALHDAGGTMRGALWTAATLCVGIGLFPLVLWPWLMRTTQAVCEIWGMAAPSDLATLHDDFRLLCAAAWGIVLLIAGLALLRHWLGRRTGARRALTWDCGFAAPTSRMQYSGASYVQPLGAVFRGLLRPQTHGSHLHGLFPTTAMFSERVDDIAERTLYAPLYWTVARGLRALRHLQRGQIRDYLAFIFATLVVLLLWEVWFGI